MTPLPRTRRVVEQRRLPHRSRNLGYTCVAETGCVRYHEHMTAGTADEPSEPLATCHRCGGPSERGQLTGNRGRWWGGAKFGWLPWPPKPHHQIVQGEPLVETMVMGIRVPAERCPACQIVWFSYGG